MRMGLGHSIRGVLFILQRQEVTYVNMIAMAHQIVCFYHVPRGKHINHIKHIV
jgi:hypothetical protein